MAPSSMKRPLSSLLATVRLLEDEVVLGAAESTDGEGVADVASSSLVVENDRILSEDDSRPFRFFPFTFYDIQ